MKLEKIAKSIENIKKNAAKIRVKSSLFLLLSLSTVIPFNYCKLTPINESPNTHITKEFKDNGEVEYNLSGTDSDGSIDYISARFNGGNPQNFGNNSSVLVPIIEGSNTVEATAYDNEGLKDSTPATDSFVSPTEQQARSFMDNIFNARSGTYNSLEEDVLVSLPPDKFDVDYKITKFGGTYAIINYVEHQEDLAKELLNKDVLDSWGIPNLYLVRIPESEINLKLNEFIGGGYN